MSHIQIELAQRYAQMQGARATWFSYARNTWDLLAKIGLVGPQDHIVACCDDFADEIDALFRWNMVTHSSEPTADAFLTASGWASDGDSGAVGLDHDVDREGAAAGIASCISHNPVDAGSAGRTPQEGSPASYAYPAGRGSARTFWLVSTIGGMGLRVPDVRALGRAATAAGALLVVDNTVASSFGCRPLALGAHISLEALDRVAAGLLGQKAVAISVAPSVTGRGRKRRVHPEAEDAFRLLTFGLGAPDAPREEGSLVTCDLNALKDGLDSLASRMQRHADHARAIAEYLSCHPLVGHVFYPGLVSHPDHDIAAQTLEHGFGPAIDWSLQGSDLETPLERHRRFLNLCAVSGRDTKAGGGATRMSVLAPGAIACIRLFAGTDDPLAVIDGIDRALRAFAGFSER